MQSSEIIAFPAIRCTRFTSTIMEYCGRYSHQKLARPPIFRRPELMSEGDCLSAARGQVRLDNGQTVLVSRNQPVYVEYMLHGTTQWIEGNVYCEGATITVEGETHEEMMVYKDTMILVEDVMLEYSPRLNQLVDTTNRQSMGYLCRPGTACRSGDAQYVYDKRPDLCPLKVVRSLNMEQVFVEGTKHFVHAQHKLYFREGDVVASPENCPSINLKRTQYHQILLTEDDISGIAMIEGNINIDLELRTSLEFAEFEIMQTARDIVQANSRRLCMNVIGKVADNDLRSPFSDNAIIRMRGDILYELVCTPVRVHFRMHEKLSNRCYRGAVIGTVGEERILLDTKTMTVHEVSELSATACADHFPEIIKTEENKFISVHPVARIEQVHAVTVSHLRAKGPIFHHQDNTEDLLYTDAEVVKYNNLLHFNRLHKLVAAKLTTNLCTHSCGMSIGQEGPLLSLNNLIPAEIPNLKTIIWDYALEAGSICGLVLFFLGILQGIWRGTRAIRPLCPCGRESSNGTLVQIHNEAATPAPAAEVVELREIRSETRSPPSTPCMTTSRRAIMPPSEVLHEPQPAGPVRRQRRVSFVTSH